MPPSKVRTNLTTVTGGDDNKNKFNEMVLMPFLNVLLTNQVKLDTKLDQILDAVEEIKEKLNAQPERPSPAVPDDRPELFMNAPQLRHRQQQQFQSPADTPGLADFKKIESIEQLEEFDENLKNEQFKRHMMNQISTFCGRHPTRKGQNLAYVLIDYMFTRELFTLVTWSQPAMTRTVKVPFTKYDRTIKFFFSAVQYGDPDFSLENTHTFLKVKVIHHSKRRSGPVVRMSSTKRRPARNDDAGVLSVNESDPLEAIGNHAELSIGVKTEDYEQDEDNDGGTEEQEFLINDLTQLFTNQTALLKRKATQPDCDSTEDVNGDEDQLVCTKRSRRN